MEWRPPREVADRILRELFAAETGTADAYGPARSFGELTGFQAAAVRRLRRIIHRHGGAILADAVGLGKTYVALALIEERVRAGDDVVVAIPAALRGLWRPLLRRVARGAGSPEPRLVSHAQLSRGVSIRAPRGHRLVVVDEAHRFRNPNTRRYGALAGLVEPAAACLFVTATPVNNAVDDLYHLVRLFLPDHGLRGAGVPSLRAAFEAPDPAGVRTGVRTVVRELVVRRSRGMVEERFGTAEPGRVRFPERLPPCIHRYRSPGIVDQVAAIDALELAAYGPGAAPLVRLGLLKRLDSSPAALTVSVGRVREYLAAFREAAQAGRLLRPGDRRVGGDADPFQLLLLGVVAEAAPPELDLGALAATANRDLGRLDRLLHGVPSGRVDRPTGEARGAGAARPTGEARDTGHPAAPGGLDPKVGSLVALLHSLAGERVLVFTEFRDTAEAVWRALLPRFRVARIDGAGAWLGPSPAGRRRVVERFAPAANGRRPPPERERVDVLVATDVLAEGLNLQDARHVVSYDLPWNPVRLLQRIGRVDRLGSPHGVVVPHLFVPADGLDAVLGLTRRLRTKLHGIASTLGEEQADALLEGLAAGRADRVGQAVAAMARDESDPMEGLRTLWAREAANRDAGGAAGGTAGLGAPAPTPAAGPVASGPVETGPMLTGPVVAGLTTDPGSGIDAIALVALPDGQRRLLEARRDGSVSGPTPATTRVLELALRTEDVCLAMHSRRSDAEEAIRRVHRYLHQERLGVRAPSPVGPRDPGPRLAGRIRAALAEAGAGVSPGTIRRAEAVLAALAVPPSPARERALAAVQAANGTDPESAGTNSLPGLLDQVEAAVVNPASGRGPEPEPADRGDGPGAVRAVLLVGTGP